MSRYNGYDDDDDDRDDRYDSDHRSTSSGNRNFGKTSNFSTMISEDGRFFGIKLDPMLADRAKNLFPMLLAYVTDKGGDWAIKEFGPKYGRLVGYGIAASEQVVQTGINTHQAVKSLNDLRAAVRPLSKAKGDVNSTSALSGDNEVVANARAKISGIYWQSLVETGVSTIGAVPALVINYKKAKTRVHDYELNRKYEEAKGDPKKLAKILDEELAGSSHALKGINAQEIRAAMDEIVETRRTEYEKKFDAFKSKHERELKTDINAVLDELKKPDANVTGHISKLRRLGVNTQGLSENIEWARRNYRNSPAKQKEEITRVVKEFTGYSDPTKRGRSSSRGSGTYIEDALRAKFVRQHGAFDQTDLEYLTREEQSQLRSNRDISATEKDRIEQQIHKMEDAHKKVEQEKENGKSETSDIKKIIDLGVQLGAGVVREMATKLVGGKTLEKYQKPIALDRILHLRRTIEEANENPSETVPPIPKSNDKDMGYVHYVHEIFQQHQKDSNWPEIGDRFTDNFEKARWDDAAIMELSDAELTPYEYAIKTIAQRVKTGRMDAIALIELVGDKQKKIVHSDGRSFGPHGAGKDDAAIKEAMLKVIDEKTIALHAGHEQTDAQINEKLGNFVFSVADLKKALESKDMDPLYRAFTFTLFSDVVGSDQKLCSRIGISNERCQELRKETTATFHAMLDGAVGVLAEMIENDPEKLDKYLKLTDKEKELIRSLAGRAGEEGKGVADLAANPEELKSLETSVANAAMTLGKAPAEADENGKPKNFWQRVVEATRKPKKKTSERITDEYTEEKIEDTKSIVKSEKSRFDDSDELEDSDRMPDDKEELDDRPQFAGKHGRKMKPGDFKRGRDAKPTPTELGV